MKHLISIIIPAYNCETTIRETLESILSQPVTDYELLIINDGSTDNTKMILQEYETQNRRVRVKTIKNSGPAEARNVGIQEAQGEYLMFVDSDDTLQPDALNRIEQILQKRPADLILFGFYIRNTIEKQAFAYHVSDCFLSNPQEIGSAFANLYFNNLLNQIWNKVYHADLIRTQNIRFQDYPYGEDRLFVLDVLQKCQNVQVLEDCFYNYFMRSTQSLVTRFYAEKPDVCNQIDQKVKDVMADLGAVKLRDMERIRYMYIKSMLSCITNLFLPSCPYTKKQKKIALQKLLSSPHLREELSAYRHYNLVTDVIAWVMKTRWIWLNQWMAKFILYMSQRHSNLFIKSKHPDAEICD